MLDKVKQYGKSIGLDVDAMDENKCVHCKQPFSKANVFTEAGWRETKISGYCEECFDELFYEE